LIELMVGLTIGLLVVIAAIGSLVFTQVTSSVVDDSSRLQQKADAIFRNIGFHVAQAGAFNLIAADGLATGKVQFSPSYTGFNASLHHFQGQEGATSSAPDTLRVSYENDGNSRDCLGYSPAVATVANVDNEFSLSGTDLRCKGATGANPEPIADGVEDFQVLYGVQTGLPGAEQYKFSAAGAVADWANVQAVRVCLQLRGDTKGNPQPGLALKGCTGVDPLPNDGYLRRVYWRTLSSRNALL
jgi:type IV pilus assembly protein PilW